MSRARRQLAFVFALVAIGVACGDPTHDDAVTALGADPTGQPNGPLHRAGQPCVTCHGSAGPASTQFVIGGTVYQVKGLPDPLANGSVRLTDATGATFDVPTNDVGNFYVTTPEWHPTYPLYAQVTQNGAEADMITHMGRDGSCCDCHTATAGPRSPGPVYLAVSPGDLPGTGDAGP